MQQHEFEVRVRYNETDPMGFLHHSHYLTYFEIGRTELLRAAGGSYRRMEEDGRFVVVVKADIRYRRPARYDDLLRVHTQVSRVSAAKIEHEYRITREDELLTTATITLAVIDREGNVCRVPDWMQPPA